MSDNVSQSTVADAVSDNSEDTAPVRESNVVKGLDGLSFFFDELADENDYQDAMLDMEAMIEPKTAPHDFDSPLPTRLEVRYLMKYFKLEK